MATSESAANTLVGQQIQEQLAKVAMDAVAALDLARTDQDWHLVAARARALAFLQPFLANNAYQNADVLIAPPIDHKPTKVRRTEYQVISRDELFSPACDLWELCPTPDGTDQRFITLANLAKVFDISNGPKNSENRTVAVFQRLKVWAATSHTELGDTRSRITKRARAFPKHIVKDFLDAASQTENVLTKYTVVKKN